MERKNFHEGHNDDFLYYNIRQYNSDLTKSVPVSVNFSRNQVFIDKVDDYKFTVEKFVIPSTNIPILMLTPNKYSVTLSYGGDDYQTFLVWNSNNPDPELQYYVWTYNEFLVSLNNALLASYNALLVAHPGVTTAVPFMLFNPVTQLFTLYAKVGEYYPQTIGGVKISFNTKLFYLYQSFENISNGFNASNGANFTISIVDRKTNTEVISATSYYAMSQDFITLAQFNEFISIVFETNMFPVRSEYVASDTGNSEIIKVLTDFNPVLFDENISNRTYLQYIPTLHRWYDMTSSNSLTNVDIYVFWTTADGTKYPLKLFPGDYLTIKLQFRKKHIQSEK